MTEESLSVFEASVLSQIRKSYWNDVSAVALHIISGRLTAEMMTKIRPEDYKPINMEALIDESLILGKMFVDEISKQEPPRHYIDKMRTSFAQPPENGDVFRGAK